MRRSREYLAGNLCRCSVMRDSCAVSAHILDWKKQREEDAQ